MSDFNQNDEFFALLAKVLLRCWIFGFILLYTWFGLTLLAGDHFHRLFGGMYGLSKHEMDLVNYCGIALLKITVIVFFLFPWLAIRLVLRGRKA